MSGVADPVLSDIAAALKQAPPPSASPATPPPESSPTAAPPSDPVLGDVHAALSGKVKPGEQNPAQSSPGVIASGLAGVNTGLIADTLGTVAGIPTALANAATYMPGQREPLFTNPLSAEWWNKQMGKIGIGTEAVQPQTEGEKIAQAAGRGAGQILATALPGKAEMAAADAAQTVASPIGRLAGEGSVAGQAALGAAGGAGGQIGEDVAPAGYERLGETVGNLAGGIIPAGAAAGAVGVARGAEHVYGAVPPLTAASRETAAGNLATQALERSAANPNATFDALNDRVEADNAELIPNSKPTTAELTNDPGLATLERTRARQNPEMATAVSEQRAANNEARVKALNALAPETASPEAAQTMLRQHLQNIDAAGVRDLEAARTGVENTFAPTQAELERQQGEAQGELTGALGEIGGGEALGTAEERAAAPAAYGAAMRDPAQDAYLAERQRLSELRNAIDPSGTMGMRPDPAKAAVADINNTFKPEGGAIYSGAERHLYDTVNGWGDLIPIEQAFQLRANINGRLAQAMDHSPQEAKRLLMLKKGIDDALADAVGDTHAAEQAGVINHDQPSVGDRLNQLGDNTVAQPTTGSSVYTPTGREVGVRYAVHDLAGENAPIASHTADGEVNREYPQALQPRDRSRAASQMQIQQMATKLQPERLGASASPQEGAPIIGPDRVVESGNGRVLAIKHAYDQQLPSAEAYRQWLQGQGYDVEGMSQPVLVRERTTPLSDDDRVAFSRESNVSSTAGMSATEQAKVDAEKLTPAVLEQYAGGDITRANNRDFARGFARSVVGPGEENQLFLPDGALSVQGAQRIRNALLHRAYGDSGLVGALSEAGDEDIKSFGGALQDASGEMSRLRGAIERGAVEPDRDITPSLVEAARLVKMARDGGRPLFDVMAQHDVFNPISEETESILRAAYGENFRGRVSRAKVGSMLAFYADEAERLGNTSDLFGETPDVNQLLQAGVSNYERNRGAAVAARKPVSASFAGAGIGEGGAETQRPELGEAGAQAAEAPAEQQPNTIVAEKQQSVLTPLTDEARQRFAEWNHDYAEMKRQFQGETAGKLHAVGKMLQRGGAYDSFRLADSEVPWLFVDGGKTAREGVQRFLAATPADAHQALDNAYSFSLRRAAQNPETGMLDIPKYNRWLSAHESGLSERRELLAQFNTAAKAQQRLNAIHDQLGELQKAYADALKGSEKGATSDHLEARDAFTKSVAGKMIGDDPDKAILRVFTGPDRAQNAKALMGLLAGNKAAIEGVQRAAIDHIIEKFSGAAMPGAESGTLKPQMLQDFIAANRSVLDVLFPNGLAKNFDALSEDLKRSQLVPNAKLPGGSDTMQLQNAARPFEAKHDSSSNLLQLTAAFGAERAGERLGHALGPVGAIAVPLTMRWMKGNTNKLQLRANQILDQMLLDPQYALRMRQAYPAKSATVRSGILNRFAARVAQTAVQTARGTDLTTSQHRSGYKRGGQIAADAVRGMSIEDQGRDLAELADKARARFAAGGAVSDDPRRLAIAAQGAHLADLADKCRQQMHEQAEAAAAVE